LSNFYDVQLLANLSDAGPISTAFARKIGADGYAGNAASAAKLATALLESRRQPA
jgi:hypothetical protein